MCRAVYRFVDLCRERYSDTTSVVKGLIERCCVCPAWSSVGLCGINELEQPFVSTSMGSSGPDVV
jgi:hypothetical protein